MDDVEKEYKTIEELVDYLVKEKNIDRSTIDISVLEEKSYLSLITPYTSLICKGRDSKDYNKHVR